MAESNQQRVNRILEHTRAGLGPYVLREFERVYGALDLQEVEQALFRGFDRGRHFADRASALARLDVQAWLNLMNWRWREVFRHRLGQTERGYVSELQGARNRSHHDAPDTRFSTDETRRVAETARLLLEAVGAAEQAREVAQIQQGLQNVLAQQAATASRRAAERVAPANATTTAGLVPWRLLVEPHRDVREGSFRKAEFAADLAQVVSGKAQAEYGDPQEFFRRTWLTEGLQNLLLNGLRRVSGQGGDPVVQLQTNFGGGKTHSMLALWHLLGGAIALSELPEGEALLQQAGDIDERIEARRAVIVGTAFDANVARQHEGCETRTIWGEIAWQLGGLEGYRLVEDADRAGISPGGDVLLTLLESHGPALVIIDELVAFARNIYGTKTPAGSFDSLMSFVQSLSEATRRSSDAILLVSIPQSRLETGGEGGQAAHDSLTNILGRIDSVWKPVSTRESFAIVRRRLFEPQVDAPARDAVLTAFHAMYRRDSRDFPREAGTSDYKQQMLEAWPVHPELFTRLYEDWTTLDRFQRTRGVLRMMAEIIHRLWAGNDQSLMIMPGSIPLHEKSVRTQVQQWLPENWPAIVESDVDGESSRPWQLDGEVSTLGKYMACRRVARAIFTGSAPATGIEATRGVDETRIRLATRQPGEPAAPFNDALRRMGNRLNYLYHEDGRYWYDTQITVARRVAEHAQGISDAEQNAAMLRRLRAQPFPRGEGLASVHVCPRDSDEVPDELKARLVLLDLDHAHRRGGADSPAMQESRIILENRGTAPRSYRNMLVFLAPDMPQVEGFRDALRDYLAWSWMRERIEEYNLDPRQARQVESSLKSTEQTLQERLQHTWRWLIVPTQRDASAALEYSPVWLSTATGREELYRRALEQLKDDEQLVGQLSPDILLEALDRTPLWPAGSDHLAVKRLCEFYGQLLYLHRVRDPGVIQRAIREGVGRPLAEAPFAHASSVAEDGSYRGLSLGKDTPVYSDGSDVIIRRAKAIALLRLDEEPEPPPDPPDPPFPPSPKPLPKRRWYGSVELDYARAQDQLAQVVEEILRHLNAGSDDDLTLTLEVQARRDSGYDEATRRTVSENSNTLGLKTHNFEEE